MYTWDAANRLAGANVNGVVSSFEYNGHGQRMQQTVDGVITEYVLDVAGGPSASLRTGLPEVIVATTGEANTYYMQIQGQVLAQYDSSPYG